MKSKYVVNFTVSSHSPALLSTGKEVYSKPRRLSTTLAARPSGIDSRQLNTAHPHYSWRFVMKPPDAIGQ